jgi:hypothetical protein
MESVRMNYVLQSKDARKRFDSGNCDQMSALAVVVTAPVCYFTICASVPSAKQILILFIVRNNGSVSS